MKKLTICLSAILLLGLLSGPAAFAAAPGGGPVASPTEPGDPTPPPTLPDPNDPDSPEEITIEEDGVPKTYKKVWDEEKEEYVYILEEDVPLADRTSPQTGETGLSGITLTAAAAAVLAVSGAEEDKEV